jgi:hypothetical protein
VVGRGVVGALSLEAKLGIKDEEGIITTSNVI